MVYVGNTICYTNHGCARRIVDNKNVLLILKDKDEVTTIAGKSLNKKIEFVSALSEEEFWIELNDIEEVLRPTSVLAGIFELI